MHKGFVLSNATDCNHVRRSVWALSNAYNELGKHYHWLNSLVMQKCGFLRYTTLTVGREKSLYLILPRGLGTCSRKDPEGFTIDMPRYIIVSVLLYILIWAICTCLASWVCMWMLSHPPVGPSLVVNWSILQWCALLHWPNLTSVMQLLFFILFFSLVICHISIPPRHQGPIQCLSTIHA